MTSVTTTSASGAETPGTDRSNANVIYTPTLIVGAGFSGIATAISLKKAGISDFIVIDRGSDVGGTWRDNTYPGAACDVPSHLYSFSFAMNKEWSRSFSTQKEIWAYQRKVARDFGVFEHTTFGVDMLDSRWDEAATQWIVTTTGATYVTDVLITGLGPLVEPNLPDIPGIEGFAGEMFHTATWPADADLRGKRVAVIGTGASAIQVIPNIVDEVGHLDVYQRTAPWVLPRFDRTYSPLERSLFRHVPGLVRVVRGWQYLVRETQVVGLTRNQTAMVPLQWAGLLNIRRATKDKELRRKLTPKFRAGCKRLLLSNVYYPALNREHTELVSDGIREVTPTGIVANDGTVRAVDVVIVATGFHVTDSPAFERIKNSEGTSLKQGWDAKGMTAYKGATVPGFPNLFIVLGPGTGLGHTSMVYMIESQVNYVTSALQALRHRANQVVNVRSDVTEAYNQRLRDRLQTSVWINGGCSSWYQDRHGNVPSVWPDWTFAFRKITKRFDLNAYDRRPRAAAAATTNAAAQKLVQGLASGLAVGADSKEKTR